MKSLFIIGLGPGHRDYVLPAAWKALEECGCIFGGKRNLETVSHLDKPLYEIGADLQGMVRSLRRQLKDRQVAVVASGDPGFYGILGFLKQELAYVEIKVVPGLSSFQYLMAAMGKSWEQARLISLHGRDADLNAAVSQNETVVVLTDHKNTPGAIIESLNKWGHGERMLCIGENLSYNNERITSGRVRDLLKLQCENPLSIVVVYHE